MATQDNNKYVVNVPANTTVVISATSWAHYHQKVNVHSDVELEPSINDVAFYGTGEGQIMTTDQGYPTLYIPGGVKRVLTLTFLFNETKPSGWRDYKPAINVKSFYPTRGRKVFIGPTLDVDVIGSNDDTGHSDYNDSLVFVAMYVDMFSEDAKPLPDRIDLYRRAPTE